MASLVQSPIGKMDDSPPQNVRKMQGADMIRDRIFSVQQSHETKSNVMSNSMYPTNKYITEAAATTKSHDGKFFKSTAGQNIWFQNQNDVQKDSSQKDILTRDVFSAGPAKKQHHRMFSNP